MAVGQPGAEQFRRAITEFRNLHIIAALGPCFDFRSEIIANDEFGTRGGVDETTKNHLVSQLLACDRMRRRVTYNPEQADLGTVIEQAIDTGNVLTISGNPYGGDDVENSPGGLVRPNPASFEALGGPTGEEGECSRFPYRGASRDRPWRMTGLRPDAAGSAWSRRSGVRGT